METVTYQIIVPFVTAFLGAFVGWFFKRHRLAKENQSLDHENDRKDITNIDAAVATWQKVVDALEGQIAKLLEQRKADADRIEQLGTKIVELQGKVDELQARLRLTEKLEKKVSRYEKIMAEHGIIY